MEIFGHRGASFDAPENTVASVKGAFVQGADGAEIDVRLTGDGQVVVIHDADTLRTTGTKLVIRESDAAAILRLDAGLFKGKAFAGQRVPLLSEVLDALPPRKRLIVEIKCGTEILAPLEKILEQSGRLSSIILFGFDRTVMAEAKRRFHAVPALWLLEAEKNEAAGARAYPADMIERAKESGLDGLGLHFDGVTAELVEAVHRAGLKLFVWTVDDEAEGRRLRSLGVDALITNRPGWLRERLGAAP